MDILEKLRKRTGESDDELLLVLLDDAKNAILSRRFPFGDWPTREVQTVVNGVETTTEETYVEDCYLNLQYRIALDLYNKQGAEGEISHSENGISRGFESSWVSEQLLQEVTPFAKAVH